MIWKGAGIFEVSAALMLKRFLQNDMLLVFNDYSSLLRAGKK